MQTMQRCLWTHDTILDPIIILSLSQCACSLVQQYLCPVKVSQLRRFHNDLNSFLTLPRLEPDLWKLRLHLTKQFITELVLVNRDSLGGPDIPVCHLDKPLRLNNLGC